MRARLECRNVGIEKVFECIAKFGEILEYKVWEYNNKVYLTFKVSTISVLEEILKKLREVCEFHFLRIDNTLPWWKRWMRMKMKF